MISQNYFLLIKGKGSIENISSDRQTVTDVCTYLALHKGYNANITLTGRFVGGTDRSSYFSKQDLFLMPLTLNMSILNKNCGIFKKQMAASLTEFMCFILFANRFLNKVLNGIKTFYPVREQVSQRCYCFLFC